VIVPGAKPYSVSRPDSCSSFTLDFDNPGS
jgi:hypothetical protein